MSKKELSPNKYYLIRTVYIGLISLVIMEGAFMYVGIFFVTISNTMSGFLLVLFFVLLVSIATLHSIYHIEFINFQVNKIRSKIKDEGMLQQHIALTKEELTHKLEQSGFKQITNTVYGIEKRGFFKRHIFIILLREHHRFQKFNDSDSLHKKIKKKFSLPDKFPLGKKYQFKRDYDITSFEIVFLHEVLPSDIEIYANECALSLVHNFREYGLLYDSSNQLLHIGVYHKKQSKIWQLMKEIFHIS